MYFGANRVLSSQQQSLIDQTTEGLMVELVFHDGDWQSKSEALHSEFSKLLEERLSDTPLFGAPDLAGLLAITALKLVTGIP